MSRTSDSANGLIVAIEELDDKADLTGGLVILHGIDDDGASIRAHVVTASMLTDPTLALGALEMVKASIIKRLNEKQPAEEAAPAAPRLN